MRWSDVCFLVTALLAAVYAAASASADELLFDSMIGGTTGTVDGGEFTPDGWKAPHQIWWDVGQVVTSGGMSVELVGWNPASDSPQHHHTKQQIINMYEMPHGSPHQSDGDLPKTSFFNVRTGDSYDNHFKFLSSTGGFDQRQETRVKCPDPCIDPEQVYTLRIEWNEAGDISVYENDALQITHNHGEPFHLRYVFLGTDNAPAGTYGPQHDVVYRNLTVWSDAAVDPEPVPEGGVELVSEPNPELRPDVWEALPEIVEEILTEDTPATADFMSPEDLPSDTPGAEAATAPDLPLSTADQPAVDQSGVPINERWSPPKESFGCGLGPPVCDCPIPVLMLVALLGALGIIRNCPRSQ